MTEPNLEKMRNDIDTIDEKLTALFKERMEISLEVAKYKKEKNLPVLNDAREKEILHKVSEQIGEPFDGYARLLYNTIFDISRSCQNSYLARKSSLADRIAAALEETPQLFPKKAVVACQGVNGSHSQTACEKLFEVPSIMYFNSLEGVFNAVKKGLCQYGILPIENSSYGTVGAVYDLMQSHNFHIARSIRLHISHNLMAKPGTQMSDNSYTRFICISKKLEIYPSANKISLILSLPHTPRSLYHTIAKFAALGINLTKLESRPIPSNDLEFIFYFDLEASVYSQELINLLSELEQQLETFVFLGCYVDDEHAGGLNQRK